MKKKIIWGVVIAVVVIGAIALIPIAKVAMAAKRQGFLDDTQMRTYSPDRQANLQAISVALQMAYESDGQYLDPKDWMDKLLLRLKTADMTEADAKLKLHRPDVATGGYGYSFNPAVAGKAKSEIKDLSKTPVVFESKAVGWNNSADPLSAAIPEAKAVMADGSIKSL